MGRTTICLLLLVLCHCVCSSKVRHVGCMIQEGNERLEKEVINRIFESRDEEDKRLDLTEQRGSFRNMVGDTNQMTVQMCVHRCWMARYTFSALQGGSRCYCANSRKGLTIVDTEAFCMHRCLGNDNQLCGGRMALSVYQTGYETEPALEPVDLSRGLLGCYEEVHWRDWCGAPEPNRQFENQHLNYEPDPQPGEVMSSRKPPLTSARMSALLCVSYCASGPGSTHMAILRSHNTCCCGGHKDRVSMRDENRVDFTRFCTLPCADSTTRPHCVGYVDGKHYVSVYQTSTIYERTNMPNLVISQGAAWLQPEFPEKETFEIAVVKTKWLVPEKEELAGVDLMLPWAENPVPPPMYDHANLPPFVQVVDEPDDENTGWGPYWILFFIFLVCLLLLFAIFLILKRRKKNRGEAERGSRPPQYMSSVNQTRNAGTADKANNTSTECDCDATNFTASANTTVIEVSTE